MKHTLFILAILTASIQTFAQSPRIKLNQITKDSVTGSVLISSPTDSGMVYSRDLFISYGVSDTVLILGGDTLAATSGIISSVLSDGVTIIGNGTIGSELTADTSVLATLRALSDSLALVISSVTADGVTITGDGSVGNPLKVDTATVVASVGRLLDSLINVRTDLDLKQDQLNGTGFVKATGTTITYDNSTYLTTEVDGSVTNEIQDISTSGAAGNISISSGSTLNLNVDDADASATNELQTLSYNSGTNEITLSDGGGTEDLSNLDLVDSTRINATGDTAYYYQNGVLIGTGAIAGGGTTYNNISETVDTVFISDYLDVDTSTLYVDATNNRVGIGTSSPLSELHLSGILTIDEKADPRYSGSISYDVAPVVPASNKRFIFNINDSTASINRFLIQEQDLNADGVDDMLFLGYPNQDNAEFVFESYKAENFTIQNRNPQTGGGDILFKTGVVGSETTLNERMRIDIDGNVGIGTSSPAQKLDVNGKVKIQDLTGTGGNAVYENGGVLGVASDARFKTYVGDIQNGIALINQLKPKYFIDNRNSSFQQLGFYAQEVKSVINEASYPIGNTDYLGINDRAILATTVKAIQEQQAIIESQATEIEQLKSQIQLILSEIEQIKNN